jgi:outer membrane protein assembly factor BamB
MNESNNIERVNQSNNARRRMRWWMPAGIVLLAAATIAYVRFAPEVEAPFRNMYTMMTVELTLLLLAVWYVFFTGLRWRDRFLVLGLGVVAVFGIGFIIAKTVRMDGSITGAGVPKLTWRWTPRPDAAVRPLQLAPAGDDRTAIDLTSISDRDFPQFLGLERLGLVRGVHLARDWSMQSPRELWRQPIGVGWSSFAIVGSCAITQEQRGGNELTVCYELETGRALWQHSNAVRFSEGLGGDGPRATPTIDAGRVYALGATGILDCLDGVTGAVLWSRDTLAENELPNLNWGKSSSPLVVDDLVVVSGGDAKRASLLAFHKETGEPAWRVGNDKAAYSSPVVATVAGVYVQFLPFVSRSHVRIVVTSPGRIPVSRCSSIIAATCGLTCGNTALTWASDTGLTGFVSRALLRPRRKPATVASA